MSIRARIRSLRLRRWPATRLAARLGVIAATIAGIAMAFHVGGQDGYTVPLSALLGAPSNGLLLGGLAHFVSAPADLIASAGPRSQWDFWHLIFCGAVAVNWTLVGVVVDLVGSGPGEPEPIRTLACDHAPALVEADELNSAFEGLEWRVREREAEPRQLLVRRAA